MFWNIQSIFNKIDSVRDVLEKHNADILAINESWMRDDVPTNLIDIPGFSIVRNDRTTKNIRGQIKRGGGLLTYVTHRLMYEMIDNEWSCVCNKDIEAHVVKITLKCTRPIYLVNSFS